MKDTFQRPDVHILLYDYTHITPGVQWVDADLAAPYWRLYWNATRGAELAMAKRAVPLDPGQMFLIPPNTSYRGRLSRPVQHLYIHFLFDLDYQGPAGAIYPFPVTRDTQAIINVLRFPAAKPAGESPKRWLSAQTLVYAAMAQLPETVLGVRYNDERIVETTDWMHSRPGVRISNDELARRAHMSTNGFIRLFRQAVGVSPQEYHLRVRVDHSCVLLHHTRQSVDQIAEATGFCDRYHFTRVFRRFRGLGPAMFRKLLP